ncbi:MAG: class I SAM-dependent methyltransferase [Candidatus Omnitrophota bacterium]|nr:class I SAM-dependent methyltransferase [Candidatus Omnitrophota bacterium]
MKQSTLEKLRFPGQKDIKLFLESGDLNEGQLRAQDKIFPIVRGIPRLFNDQYDRYASRSFSAEWEELQSSDDVWGRPIPERMKELEFLEIPLARLKGLDFLDCGCGNGLFARAVALNYQANVIGLDISRGLELANALADSAETIDFVQADAQFPPFANESFDLIWCAGSIHHTPNPRKTFQALAPLLKKGGRIFLWLYTSPAKITFRLRARRLTKEIVYRLPGVLQDIAVFLIACFTLSKQSIHYKILKGKLRVPFVPKLRHHLMMARDAFTVRYDWCLTKEEIILWHKECSLKTIYAKYVELDDGPWLAALAER